MRSSSPRPERRGDDGSAAVEFLTLGVLLLVPLVYLVLTLGALQGAAFAAEGAARQAARALVTAPDDATGRVRAAAAVRVALDDWRIAPDASAVAVSCTPVPADCATARGTVRVAVRVAVALPLLPRALAVDAPATIPVQGSAVQRVSMFQAAR
ncbi:hypothetical protein QDR37_15090 [Amnibacterium sp. CER49]|uniref:hypothetical protein n=1 Tax=Amnibacterium sp. CER49 TaxID=3039161 RepID=UPI00244A6054|nr:hypothetical protein [Amnibacterium sp. CER49]MDH2445276.1 hypothetical protein [Amnibacterium sp. CER49]